MRGINKGGISITSSTGSKPLRLLNTPPNPSPSLSLSKDRIIQPMRKRKVIKRRMRQCPMVERMRRRRFLVRSKVKGWKV